MSIIAVNHIQANCRQRFTGLIDLTDIGHLAPQDQDNHFLTRALAAFSISAVARIDDATAAKHLVDEYKDDGIDAFYFDRAERVCYLVQSKWDKTGNGSIDLGSTLKFIQGINHFMGGEVQLLGPKLQAHGNEIKEALEDSQTTFVFVICYTGKQPLASDVAKPLNDLVDGLNDGIDYVSLRVLKQDGLHKVVEQAALGESIDLTLMLHDWGKIRDPYEAYYGQLDIADLKSWAKFGDRLYIKNIRGYKGSTDVNDAISETLKNTPDNFLYFNNGITLLCARIEKQPLGGQSRESGVFECKGASVVNGAQTVGSILTFLSGPGVVPTNAKIMVRIISLEKGTSDFGVLVTKATNTQNRIENKDFAALDEEQSRLRTDMLLSLQKQYAYKTGDQPPKAEDGCTLDEATVALACAQSDISFCMTAKTAVGKLYEDVTKPPYTILFNSALTAPKLWRSVLISRRVESCLEQHRKVLTGKDRLIAVHGNRFVLHLVFRVLGESIFSTANFEQESTQVDLLVPQLLSEITAQIAKDYSQGYPAVIFKNTKKCTAIALALG